VLMYAANCPHCAGEAMRNGEVSFWYAANGGLPARRPTLRGFEDADVSIVGAGLTGLWTAYYLKKAAPAIRVVVCEAEFAGFGASGRNGGWLSGLLPGSREQYAAVSGKPAVLALQRELFAAVDQVAQVCRDEGIDADLVKGGSLRVATNRAQERRLRAALDEDRAWGLREEDVRYLSADELADRIRIAGAQAALYTPHCARIQPAKLVTGLASAVERLGVTIHEGTRAQHVEPHLVKTPLGGVTTRTVLLATEGFTALLGGRRRQLLPMNSSLIVTEPLSEAAWREIGWDNAETLDDEAHAYIYAQRTADGRIAIGGRGVPYRFGSRPDSRGGTAAATVAQLRTSLARLFPASADAAIDHAWSGVLGVPRDWCAGVVFDRAAGFGWAGGYTGHGVTAAHLAGQTLADLVLGTDTPRTRLPWVGHQAPNWEPEPLRWLGVHALYAAYRSADRREAAGLRRSSWLAVAADAVSKRPG
jgi:glycine/D-amino acid oxidase-like deaminating enzyme